MWLGCDGEMQFRGALALEKVVRAGSAFGRAPLNAHARRVVGRRVVAIFLAGAIRKLPITCKNSGWPGIFGLRDGSARPFGEIRDRNANPARARSVHALAKADARGLRWCGRPFIDQAKPRSPCGYRRCEKDATENISGRARRSLRQVSDHDCCTRYASSVMISVCEIVM